jgi:wyosine [tRNA(Phe)-imidazoG37] synthetase (radical SAM superfamily)
MAHYKRLYGPVPSRRLGRSLGLDMVPMKMCCYDCIYCQLGPTTEHTTHRSECTDIDQVLADLERWLDDGGTADYLTFAGCGEPTLNLNLGEAIARARQMTDIPTCVLTNGALLWKQGVRDSAMQADLIIPSLDAGTEDTFRRINRPANRLTLDQVIDGLCETASAFHGEVWLEVMLVAGVNDSDQELAALGEAVRDVGAARVQINTVVRPSGTEAVERVDNGKLVRARVILGATATVISSAWEHGVPEGAEYDEQEVLALISYRPCTMKDVAHGLGMHPNEALKHLLHLVSAGELQQQERDGQTFFVKHAEWT